MHPSLRILAAGFALAAAAQAHAYRGEQPAYPAGTPVAATAQDAGRTAAAGGAATGGAAMTGAAIHGGRAMPMGSAMHDGHHMRGDMGKRQDATAGGSFAGRSASGNHLGRPIIPGA